MNKPFLTSAGEKLSRHIRVDRLGAQILFAIHKADHPLSRDDIILKVGEDTSFNIELLSLKSLGYIEHDKDPLGRTGYKLVPSVSNLITSILG